MPVEETPQPLFQIPEAVFGLTAKEQHFGRVTHARFLTLLDHPQSTVHEVSLSTNLYGEFLFVTTSRPAAKTPALLTFYGLGFHEARERWLVNEWFWYQAQPFEDRLNQSVSKEDAKAQIQKRRDILDAQVTGEPQTERGRLFEMIADLTDDDAAYAELEDLEGLFLLRTLATAENTLLEKEIREEMPDVDTEVLNVDMLARVRFYTPDDLWVWYAAAAKDMEEDVILWGLVVGEMIEVGYFKLSDLENGRGPWGMQVERDLDFEPQTLRALQDTHQQKRR